MCLKKPFEILSAAGRDRLVKIVVCKNVSSSCCVACIMQKSRLGRDGLYDVLKETFQSQIFVHFSARRSSAAAVIFCSNAESLTRGLQNIKGHRNGH